MNGYEPFELGGVWSWFRSEPTHPITMRYDIPSDVFDRLVGGEFNAKEGYRAYDERSEALAGLEQALKDADGNFITGAA